ncbi:MAG: DEAD/DEAH box helicase [Bacteroidetes bacterium]|nr:DEAD/DEAH box helicase [Bacteroidota bacterium]
MSNSIKNQKNILDKFSIEQLNPMQEEARLAIHSNANTVLLSPTGTGKTLAFLLPIIKELDAKCPEIQTLIIVPSRELAIQTEQVVRQMGTGFKVNAIYGGRSGTLDKIDIKHRPAILVGTPGRIADHLRRENFTSHFIKTLVLDEFDKSLEVGFEAEMNEIIDALPNLEKRILTSATEEVKIPEFVGLENPVYIDYSHEKVAALEVKIIISPEKDKLGTLVDALHQIGNQPGIIFCSFKETIQRVSTFLSENNIRHGCFHGGMEQVDRERALIKFRNGTHQILVATDLAARGIDIPEIKYIIHYHIPIKDKEFTHRNGRTARMKKDGTAFVLKWKEDEIPDFIQILNPKSFRADEIQDIPTPKTAEWNTLYISGGRKDKISKGDIAGLLFKKGNLSKDELGTIEIKQDCAFVGVHASKMESVIHLVNNSKLKKKKVRISEI